MGRVIDARGDVELGSGTSIEVYSDVLREREKAHLQRGWALGEQRGVEIRGRCAARYGPSLQPTHALRIARELEEGRGFRSAHPQRERARKHQMNDWSRHSDELRHE